MAAFEEKQASREAGASGAPAEPAEPLLTELANLTELNAENLTRKIIEHRYSEKLIKDEITRLAPAFRMTIITPKTIPAYRPDNY